MSKKNKPPVKKQTAPAKSAPANENKLDVKEIVKVAGILTAICIVISAALAGVNMLTSERIAQIAKENEFAACEQVFPPEDDQKLEFVNFADIYPESGVNGYLAAENGKAVGCVIITSAKGYGGDVEVMVGFDMNRTVTGVSVLSHSETPGLGANAAKESFLSQYVSSSDAGNLAVTKDGGTVDAVTAATISSRAVTAAVNAAAESFDALNAAGQLKLPEGYSAAASGSDVVSTTDVVSEADVTSGSDANNNEGGAE